MLHLKVKKGSSFSILDKNSGELIATVFADDIKHRRCEAAIGIEAEKKRFLILTEDKMKNRFLENGFPEVDKNQLDLVDHINSIEKEGNF